MEFRFAAQALKDLTPPGPHKRRALNALEEAMLIAIAAVHVADARSLAQLDRDASQPDRRRKRRPMPAQPAA